MLSIRSITLSLLLLISPSAAYALEATASVYPVWLLLREVAADVPEMHCSLLLPASTGCPHDYAMTPHDRQALARTDLLVINGLGLEGSLGSPATLRTMMKPGASLIDCSEGLEGLIARPDQALEHMQHGATANPHIFASPSMMMRMARSLEQGLSRIDPAHAEAYAKGRSSVESALSKRVEQLAAVASKAAGRPVIPQHDIFDYLLRDAGFSVAAHVQTDEESMPSAAQLAALVRLARKDVCAVITEPQYPARTADTICSESGVPCIEIDPAATGSESASFATYLENLDQGITKLEGIIGN